MIELHDAIVIWHVTLSSSAAEYVIIMKAFNMAPFSGKSKQTNQQTTRYKMYVISPAEQ